MTKLEARAIILVLALLRISFKLHREPQGYRLSFDKRYHLAVTEALGD